MSRRTLSSAIAFALLVLLGVVAVVLPVPYVVFSPGPTVDILAEQQGRETVAVSGHKAYRDNGEIRFVTVSVTSPDQHIDLFSALGAWIDPERALYPRDVIYPPGDTAESIRQESSVQMVSSQDAAIATALRELGYKLPEIVEVFAVTKGGPADGALKVRDQVLKVDGVPVTTTSQVTKLVQRAGAGSKLTMTVRRDGKVLDLPVTPRPSTDSGKKRALIGIVVGPGFDFPFDVRVNVSDSIGGPSAGLMFSLAVYDTLTPGSLTHGKIIAGTGTIDEAGKVGDIGGIQQKIVGAERSGAELFLVPPGNCGEAKGAPLDGIRLVRAPTMHSALSSIETWTKNPDASLPSC